MEYWTPVSDELRKQLKIAWPIIVSNLLNFSRPSVSLMFVGHLGESIFAGMAIGSSFAYITGFYLMLGLVGALDTLCGQAFGAKRDGALGIHMQRAMLVLSVAAIPVSLLWAFSDRFLILLRQNEAISREAGIYTRWLIPALFGYALVQCQSRYFQAQRRVMPYMLSSAATSLCHILCCWLLVDKFSLGSKGAAIANGLSYWINFFILSCYIKLAPACKTTWTGFSKEALHNLPDFVRLAIPSALMLCLQYWSFEILVILSGLLPNPKMQTSALSIMLNISAIVFMIPTGLSAATSVRVSNELGANNPPAARLAIRVSIVMALTEGLTVATIIVSLRHVLVKAYSKEDEVVKYVASLMPFLALSHFIDGFQCVLSGATRGCGRQRIGALVNLGAYYLIGIPTSVVLAFLAHQRGKGLWIGNICALAVQDVLYGFMILSTDWDKQADEARQRTNSNADDDREETAPH